MKPIYFSKTAIMGLLLIAQAAIQAVLDGGSWPEIVQAVFGALVIYFRGAATKATYWVKKPENKDQIELAKEIEKGLAEMKEEIDVLKKAIPPPPNGSKRLSPDKEATHPGILKPKGR